MMILSYFKISIKINKNKNHLPPASKPSLQTWNPQNSAGHLHCTLDEAWNKIGLWIQGWQSVIGQEDMDCGTKYCSQLLSIVELHCQVLGFQEEVYCSSE